MKLPVLLLFVLVVADVTAEDEVTLRKPNESDGLSVVIAPQTQEVKHGDDLRFDLRYEFKQLYRAMNVFALTHNHPHPTSELRFFRDDGTFFAVLQAHGFAGMFPDHEYRMIPESSIGFGTTVPTMAKSAIFPREIPPGVYQIQLAVYNKISAGIWSRKESPAKAVLFSNTVMCTIKAP